MKQYANKGRVGGQSESYYVVKIDAPPGVEVPGGCYVTVQSGPHVGLSIAYTHLKDPKPRAHTLPDIVFLPSHATVLSLDEKVALKPYLLARALDVDSARIQRDQRGSTSGGVGKRSAPVPPSRDVHGLKTPPGKMAPPVQVIDSMEKGVEGQDPKRPRLGKLSPKALFPDEKKTNEGDQAQGSLADNMSALRAACTARLMWMISNQQRYQMAHPPQQPPAAMKEEEKNTRELEKEDSKIDIESVEDKEESACVEGNEHSEEKGDDLRRDDEQDCNDAA